MVRLKFSVTPTKQKIGVVINRNKNEGSVFAFFEFVGGFLVREIAFRRLEGGGLIVISPG